MRVEEFETVAFANRELDNDDKLEFCWLCKKLSNDVFQGICIKCEEDGDRFDDYSFDAKED